MEKAMFTYTFTQLHFHQRGKNHVFVLSLNNSDLIDSYMTFETRHVEVLCLLTGTSQWQQLNVTLRDFWMLAMPIVDLRNGATDCWYIRVYIRQQMTLQFCDWGCDSCFSMCCNSSLLCSWNVGESDESQAKKRIKKKNKKKKPYQINATFTRRLGRGKEQAANL